MDQMPTTQTCCCDLVTLYIDDTASREAVDWLDQLADCEDDLNDVGISIVKVKHNGQTFAASRRVQRISDLFLSGAESQRPAPVSTDLRILKYPKVNVLYLNLEKIWRIRRV